MEVKPLNSMGSLQPWLQVVRAVNPSASSQVTRKPCFEYDSVLLFENSSIDRVVPEGREMREGINLPLGSIYREKWEE